VVRLVKKLEELLKQERHRSFAFADAKKEFMYLRMVNTLYFDDVFDIDKVYDFALDAYNYWKENKVLYAKQEALLTTFRMMYSEYTKNKKDIVLY
jgi:hypothetical protein